MEAFLGQIIMFAGTFVPSGWALCNGSKINIADNPALFAVLGAMYGGDGVKDFALPDLRGRLPLGAGKAATGTTYTVAGAGGAETVTLAAAAMPAHTHPLNATSAAATTNAPSNALLGAVPAGDYFYFAPPNPVPTGVTVKTETLAAGAIQAMGGNQAHSNVMPSFGMNFIICTNGLFPVAQP